MEGYPRPQGPQYPGYYQKPSNGVTILVLGIMSIVVCGPILGPIAWVMGNQSLRDIRMGIMDPRDEGMVVAGRIMGIVMTCLALLAVIAYCGFFVLIIGLGAAGAAAG